MRIGAVPITALVALGTVVLWAVTLAGSVWILASQPTLATKAAVAVPTFDTPRSVDAWPDGPAPLSTLPRSTLLPGDCSEVLAGPVDVAALFAAPVGSYTDRTVVGVASPSVGMLEQLSCTYQRQDTGENSGPLVLRLAAFADPAAAESQRNRNIAAEADDTRSARPVMVGNAHATLLTQPRDYLMLLAYDRYTMTLDLARGIVPDQNVEPVLTDLARRVWPNLAPARNPHPAAHDATTADKPHATDEGRHDTPRARHSS
jgi:hypothetical protein